MNILKSLMTVLSQNSLSHPSSPPKKLVHFKKTHSIPFLSAEISIHLALPTHSCFLLQFTIETNMPVQGGKKEQKPSILLQNEREQSSTCDILEYSKKKFVFGLQGNTSKNV